MTPALELRGLQVRFPRFSLGPLELSLAPGRVVGLVGPNGSGKTTTLRCLAGNLYPDAGSFAVHGRAPAVNDGSWKAMLGYVPDRPVFYEWQTAGRFLRFVAGFYPDWSTAFAESLASRLGLDLEAKLAQLSPGNRVKVALVAALAHRPRLALFDEPTAGLDPVVRAEVFDLLSELMEDEGAGTSVVYSTHNLDDLQRLADELVFLHDGAIRLHTDKDGLLDRWRRLLLRHEGDLGDVEGVVRQTRQGDTHELISENGERTRRALRERGIEDVRELALALEEIAVQIMKGGGHA